MKFRTLLYYDYLFIYLFIQRHIQIAMTIVPRLQNSSYRHQPKGKTEKQKRQKTYSVVYK